jgi:hypothetical protein
MSLFSIKLVIISVSYFWSRFFDILRAKRNKNKRENVSEKVKLKLESARGHVVFKLTIFPAIFFLLIFPATMDINFINLNLVRKLC